MLLRPGAACHVNYGVGDTRIALPDEDNSREAWTFSGDTEDGYLDRQALLPLMGVLVKIPADGHICGLD